MATALADQLRKQREVKPILLMTHIVLGHPSYEEGDALVGAMVRAGVDLVELQIPFSEPIADGPVILEANARSLARGARVSQAFAFAREVTARYPIPFVFMTYYNIVFRYGVERFVAEMAAAGVRGAIIPDLPPEEAGVYLAAMADRQLAPVFIFSPRTPPERMQLLASHAQGFVYCVARKGVTGASTEFADDLAGYLRRCRAATRLPLALGFGVKSPEDITFLTGKVDLAVVGSETLRVIERAGIVAVEPFLRGLRPGAVQAVG
jgi:tryptophan synthase alpha chain